MWWDEFVESQMNNARFTEGLMGPFHRHGACTPQAGCHHYHGRLDLGPYSGLNLIENSALWSHSRLTRGSSVERDGRRRRKSRQGARRL